MQLIKDRIWTIFKASVLKYSINVFLLYHIFKFTWSATGRRLVGDRSPTGRRPVASSRKEVPTRSSTSRRSVGNQSPISRLLDDAFLIKRTDGRTPACIPCDNRLSLFRTNLNASLNQKDWRTDWYDRLSFSIPIPTLMLRYSQREQTSSQWDIRLQSLRTT